MDVRTSLRTNGGDALAKFGEIWKTQVDRLKEKFAGAILETALPPQAATDAPIIYVTREKLLDVLRFLRDEPGFEYGFLSDLTATDEQVDPRFEVIYQLFSLTKHNRIRVKVSVPEGQEVPSATPLWPAADWAEREVWDMFGVRFSGHPNLRRILMDERWKGHPLRKDYPLRGYQLFTEPQPVHPDQMK